MLTREEGGERTKVCLCVLTREEGGGEDESMSLCVNERGGRGRGRKYVFVC